MRHGLWARVHVASKSSGHAEGSGASMGQAGGKGPAGVDKEAKQLSGTRTLEADCGQGLLSCQTISLLFLVVHCTGCFCVVRQPQVVSLSTAIPILVRQLPM